MSKHIFRYDIKISKDFKLTTMMTMTMKTMTAAMTTTVTDMKTKWKNMFRLREFNTYMKYDNFIKCAMRSNYIYANRFWKCTYLLADLDLNVIYSNMEFVCLTCEMQWNGILDDINIAHVHAIWWTIFHYNCRWNR